MQNEPALSSPGIPAYILAGGKSRRFGSDKARISTPAGPLIQVLAEQLRHCSPTVTVVADLADKYCDLGLFTIADIIPEKGPLAGLLTALENARETALSDWILVLTCDATQFQPDWFLQLSQSRNVSKTSAILFQQSVAVNCDRSLEQKRYQPFPGLYQLNLIPEIVDQLQGDNYSLQQLLCKRDVRVQEISVPVDWPAQLQINTQDDFDRWQQVIFPGKEGNIS